MILFPFQGGQQLHEYVAKYRRPELPPIEVSGPLDLFPEESCAPNLTPRLTWRDPWPHGDRPGVYLIYSADCQLLYIGKASMNRSLGHRLYDYFGGGKTCILRQT